MKRQQRKEERECEDDEAAHEGVPTPGPIGRTTRPSSRPKMALMIRSGMAMSQPSKRTAGSAAR
jgi:hypothetical protein